MRSAQQPHPRAALEWKKLDILDLRTFLSGWGVVHGPMARASQGTGCGKMALVVLFQYLGDARQGSSNGTLYLAAPAGGNT